MSELKAVVAVYHASDRMKYWSKLGVFWGSIWGLLSGTVFFAVAGTGPVLVAGSLLTSIIAALQGGVVVGRVECNRRWLVQPSHPERQHYAKRHQP